MRIAGKELVKRNFKRIKLVRQDEVFEFTICPLPPAFYEKMRSVGLMDFPQPPKKPLMDHGRPVKNRDTGRVELVDDESDPGYRQKLAAVNRRLRAVKLAAHLRDDPEVAFEAKEPVTASPSDWLAYADALKDEISDPDKGLTDDEVDAILDKADNLKSVLDLDEAINDFLPTA